MSDPVVTGQCYCGAVRLEVSAAPRVVSYCHCSDCRRVTGAPFAAFVAFDEGVVRAVPGWGEPVCHNPGVKRCFCCACGSPLGAVFHYLPDQHYAPIGILDQAADLPPAPHSHANSALPWLHLTDDLPHVAASARDALSQA